MKKAGLKKMLVALLSVCMVFTMMPVVSFGGTGSDEAVKYRIVATPGYGIPFNSWTSATIGESVDENLSDKATPGFAFYGEKYQYELRADGETQTSSVTWKVTAVEGNLNSLISYSSGYLNRSTLEFTATGNGKLNIEAYYSGTLVRKATVTISEQAGQGSCGKSSSDYVSWKIDKAGTLTISGTGRMENYAYGESPWYSCRKYVKSIAVGDGVTTIGSYAFQGCSKAADVSIGNAVTAIGQRAFKNCKSITSISIPDSVTAIYQYAFKGCSGLENIKLSENLEILSEKVFYNCLSLKALEIPDKVDSICGSTCYGCKALKKLVLPEGLKSIDDDAFYDCESLTALELPAGLEWIGYQAFRNCTSITGTVTIPGAVLGGTYYDDCCDCCNGSGSEIFRNCNKITKVVIGDGATSVNYGMFMGCRSIQSVELPESITYIERKAFYDCTSLESIKLPSKLKYIYSHAFYNCKSMVSIYIPSSVRSIYTKAVGYISGGLSGSAEVDEDFVIYGVADSEAQSYAKENGIKFKEKSGEKVSLSDCTICGVSNQKYTGSAVTTGIRIYNPKGVLLVASEDYETSYKDNVNTGTATVTITAVGDDYTGSVERQFSIENKTDISGCTVSEIDSQGYTGEAITPSVTVTSGSTLTEGEDYTVSYENNIEPSMEAKVVITGTGNYTGEKLVDFTISKDFIDKGTCGETDEDDVSWMLGSSGTLTISGTGSMENFSDGSDSPWYAYRSKIKAIVIEDGIASIGGYAFSNCYNATSVKIGDSVLAIGQYAFQSCSSVKSIDISDKLTTIYRYAFNDCYNLEEISLPESLKTIREGAFQSCRGLKEMTIPVGVDVIPEYLCCGCSSLDNVTVKGNAKTVGSYAFSDCRNLKAINLPDSVETIGNSAFSSCYSLAEISVPDSVEIIEPYAFSDCTSLKNIKLPENLQTISYGAFRYCTSLESVNLPESLKTLGSSDDYWYRRSDNGVFSGCTSLVTISSMGEISYISGWTFYNCTALKSVNVPGSAEHIGEYAFYNCTSLENVNIENGLENINNNAFQNCTLLKSIDLPNSVKRIYDSAFYNCKSLSGVQLSLQLLTIGQQAFYDCEKLKSMTLPKSVTSIGNKAIGYHYSDLSGSEEVLDGFIIYGTEGSQAETYANSNGITFRDPSKDPVELSACEISTIPEQAYTGEAIIPDIRILSPDSKWLEDGKDYTVNCSNNTDVGTANVTITGTGDYTGEVQKTFAISSKTSIAGCDVTDIENQEYTGSAIKPDVTVYMSGAELTESTDYTLSYENNTEPSECAHVVITGAGKYCGEKVVAFTINKGYVAKGNCGYKGGDNVAWRLDVNGKITISGSGRMEDYGGDSTRPWNDYISDIKEIEIEEGVTTVGSASFSGCSSATTLTIGNTVTDIGYSAFNSSGLKTVEIPGSVKNINHDAFSYCTSMSTLKLNDGLESIGYNAFYDCYNLKSIIIPGSVKQIYHDAFNQCNSLTSVILKNGVESIGYNAFYDCYNLTSIELPETLKTIGYGAFYYCRSLEEIDLPDNLANIGVICQSVGNYCYYGVGYGAFSYCTSLKSIEISDSVETLGCYTFYGCSNLAAATLGNGLTTIGDGAFRNCTSLKNIEIPDSVETLGCYTFYECSNLESLSMGDGLKTIRYSTFSNCKNLKSIEFGANLKSIGDSAFYGCSSIKNIVLHEGLTEIDSSAFNGCVELEKVSLPSTLKTIESNAFYACDKLAGIEVPTNVSRIYDYALGYVKDGLTGDEYQKVEGFTIIGFAGTAAEQYASDNGFNFSIKCSHENLSQPEAYVEAKAATCCESGNIAYYKCPDCGRLFSDTAATHEYTQSGVIEKPLGHAWNEGEVTKNATATEKGVITYTCTRSNCGVTKTEELDVIGSDPTKADITTTPSLTAAGLDTVNKIEDKLSTAVEAQTGYEDAETAYMDISMQVSLDNGKTYVDATAENFPEEGLTITIPYSWLTEAGITVDENSEFTVVHMFTTTVEGKHKAGDTEVLKATRTDAGLQITVTGLSPFAVAAKSVPKYKISGLVNGHKGSGAVSIEVMKHGESALVKSAVASAAKYEVDGLEAGQYDVYVSAEGDYIGRTYTVDLEKDTTLDVGIYLLGDTNMDGSRTADDVTVLARHVAKIETQTDEYALKLFDANRDGKVNSTDITHLARYFAKIIDEL